MTATTAVSTDDFAPRERAPVWREWIWKHFGGLESDLYGDTDFDGHMASARAGDVILTKLEANRHRVVRTQDMVRASVEQAMVDDLAVKKPDYVVVLQRSVAEYGSRGFGVDYAHKIMAHIEAHYTPFAQYGPLPFAPDNFSAVIFKLKQ